MGCGASNNRQSNTQIVNVDAADWNTAYHGLGSGTGTIIKKKNSKQFSRAKSNVFYKDNKVAAINSYTVTTQLGKGAFGEVFLASMDDEQYAIKVLKKAAMKSLRAPPRRPGGGGGGGGPMDSLKSEIATLKKIAHPNCVQMHDVIYDDDVGQVFIVLEYVDGGTSQKNDAEGNPVPLPERTIWSHLRHFVMGLEYLHMHGIVHRDIKPDNLMVTRPGRMYAGSAGVLKITDFGTSAFCSIGDPSAKKTQGTPQFFAPEMCAEGSSGTYDPRVLDLWAAGVTLYLWASGRLPFMQPTVMLLMQDIAECAPVLDAPKETSEGLGGVIRGLLTRDVAKRITLSNLRLHEWLTDESAQPLPVQPVVKIEVTDEEIAQAVTNRALIQEGSAAGPSAIGETLSLIGQGDSSGGWKREGMATIRKRTTQQDAMFWKAISASGHLAPHLPIIYSIGTFDDEEEADGGGGKGTSTEQVYDIRMQDLVAPMARPCALGLIMGSRTTTPLELHSGALAAPIAELLPALTKLRADAPTADEVGVGAVTPARYLQYIDDATSTSTLGFRLDGGKTVVHGELAPLPLPNGTTYNTLQSEGDVVTTLKTFLQADAGLAHATLLKVQSVKQALERSDFFNKHVLLRSRLLLVYDDAAREARLELKLMNFAWSYALAEGASVDHVSAWDGTEASHEDGYLLGVQSLERCMAVVCEQLGPPPMKRITSYGDESFSSPGRASKPGLTSPFGSRKKVLDGKGSPSPSPR